MTPTTSRRLDGYRGIWYANQPQDDEYRYKYSGGFATYPQQHVPIAIHTPEVNKTFFCYGGRGDDERHLLNMLSFYDHATGQVPQPVVVMARQTNDTHYNPTLAVAPDGHLLLFCNSHGQGYELTEEDPTHGKAFIVCGREPFSIDSMDVIHTDNFSYSQPWLVAGSGVLWLHTRYDQGRRRLFWATSRDGLAWSEPRQLTHMQRGNYQISWCDGERVATAFDYHPEDGGLNARTNIYYLQTTDFGQTWTTITGQPVETPLVDVHNPALVHDYAAEHLLVYLKDLTFDHHGHPVILYLTSRGYASGPAHGPRVWWTARWTGSDWKRQRIVESDHNYDHGSLYIEPDGVWRLIAPTDPGPQPHTTGGDVVVHVSDDQGCTWRREGERTVGSGRNQTYVRRPLRAHDDFLAFWADGNPLEPSKSCLYFSTRSGDVYQLPEEMTEPWARPRRVG